jgi:hypothetical protein
MKQFKYWQSLPIQRNPTKALIKGRLSCPGDPNDINSLLVDFVLKWTRCRPGESIHEHRYIEHLRDIIAPDVHGPWRSRTQEDFAGPGYLQIVFERRKCGDQMERWCDPGSSIGDSIIAGVYIHAQATSILKRAEENRIVGLMTDTTWNVRRQYVTAFLVAIARNIAIPLAFVFGPAKTAEPYESFYEMFRIYNVDLSTFVMQSDQGTTQKKSIDSRITFSVSV